MIVKYRKCRLVGKLWRKMRDDAAFLIGRDDQRRQVRSTTTGLQRGNLRPERFYVPALEIVAGDINAGNQSCLRQPRHLLERGIANHEMPAQPMGRGSLRVKHILLAHLEPKMRCQDRQRRQTPEQDKHFPCRALPVTAEDQYNGHGTADCGHAPPNFWVGKAPLLNYFTGIPFDNAWLLAAALLTMPWPTLAMITTGYFLLIPVGLAAYARVRRRREAGRERDGHEPQP
jgi:hypothetical protein